MFSLKKAIRHLLKKTGWYEHIKFSAAFHFYERIFKPQVEMAYQKEVNLYRSFLPPCRLIFDIGANDGHKTKAFLKISGRVVACEPDSYNYRLLQIRFRRFAARVTIERVALAADKGEARLYIHYPGSGVNTLNPDWKFLLENAPGYWDQEIKFTAKYEKVQTTTLDDLIARHGLPQFIKIDTEGYEKLVLRGLSQKVNTLSFECMLPNFKADALDCLEQLQKINSDNSYNVICNERLLLKEFVDVTKIQEWLDQTDLHHLEIVVRMK